MAGVPITVIFWQRVREAYGAALLRRWPLNWGPVVRIHPLSLKAYVLQTITTLVVKYTDIASLQAGSYGVFPKSTKETPKICLVY